MFYQKTSIASVLLAMAFILGFAAFIQQPAISADQWKVKALNPWVEADASTLNAMMGSETSSIDLSGPRNDWLTGALGISADADTPVTVTLNEPAQLKGRVELKVVGLVKEREQGLVVWDPLISKADIPNNAVKALNFEQIKDFPTIKVTPKVPAFLWLTVDLRGVKSGKYTGTLNFTDDSGISQKVKLNIDVLNAEIPVDNPLKCITWQWANSDQMIRDFIDHGVNVTYRDHEKWWKQGCKYLMFQFSATFSRKPLDDERKQAIKKELDEVYALVDRLKVPKDSWGLYVADEPCDSNAKIDAENEAYIEKLRPGTPIYTNPAWGMAADKGQNTTTTKGTIDVLTKYTSVWCPYFWHLWDGSGAIQKMKATKKPVWFYEIYTAAANRRPQVGRDALRMLAWQSWRYDLQGMGMFSANDTASDVWYDLPMGSNGYANYSFTYPGANGIMSCRGFEALRQGIQEYKRLYVLKNMKVDRKLLNVLSETAFTAAAKQNGAVGIDAVRQQLDILLVDAFAKKSAKK